MRTLALAWALSASLVHAAEIAVSEGTRGPAAADQFSPSISSDGRDYLVVWTDQRAMRDDTYATRVTSSGLVLDPAGIRIGAEGTCERGVVWTGVDWLIVWTNGDGKLRGARVSREGELVRPEHVLADGVLSPSVLQAGAHTVVGYSARTDPFEPRALIFDTEGRMVADVQLATGEAQRQAPVLGWNGTTLVAAWVVGPQPQAARIEAVRFSAGGVVDDEPRTIVGTGAALAPRLASDGDDFLLLSRDENTRLQTARRVSSTLSSVGDAFALPPAVRDRATAVWSGSSYAVVGEHGASVAAIRLDADGRPAEDDPIVLEEVENSSIPEAVLATNGDDLFVAWVGVSEPGADSESLDIYGGRLSATMAHGADTRLLSMSARRQTDALVVAGEESLLLLWREESSAFARRIALDGAPLDEKPVLLSSYAGALAGTWNGSDFVVAWSEPAASRIVTRRLAADGLWSAEGSAFDAVTLGTITLAADGDVVLLAWRSDDAVRVARVAGDGRIMDSVPLTVARGDAAHLALAGGGGTGFLLVWHESEVIDDAGRVAPVRLRGARVTRELTSLFFDGFAVVDSEGLEGFPSVARDRDGWVVAWQRLLPAGKNELRALRLADDGGREDAGSGGIVLVRDAVLPQIAWAGDRYVAGWIEDSPAGRRLRTASAPRLSSFSSSLDVGESDASASVTIAPLAAGRVAFAYSRLALEGGMGGVSRAYVDLPPPVLRRRSVR